MRVSTNQLFQANLNAMLEQQSALSKTHQQLSTGRRLSTPADDPAGAARILDLSRAIDATAQHQKNADVAQARLGLADHTLTSVGDLLQRVRELALQGNNDSQTNDSRRAIAQEVRQRLHELLALANTRDANGEHLFGGHQGLTTPFAANGAGSFSYNGDEGQRFLQIGPNVQIAVSDPGTDVFQRIGNGNGIYTTLDNPANTGTGVINPAGVSGGFVPDTYTLVFSQPTPASAITYTVTGAVSGVVASGTYSSGGAIGFNGVQINVSGAPADGDSFTVSPSAHQDMFTTVHNLLTTLETNVTQPTAQARLHNAMNRALGDLDQALGRTLDTRAAIGARLNALGSQVDTNAAATLQLQETLSAVQDLDVAEAVSRLNRQLVALQAAQQAFVKIQDLSLFNFIR